MKVELNISTAETIKRNHGLQKGGPVQKLVDSEAMRYMSDYMPRRQAGELEHMMIMARGHFIRVPDNGQCLGQRE